MNIVAIDDRKDLFQVKDVISNKTMDKLSKVELEDVSWTKQEWQEDWKRRKLDVAPDSIFEQIQKEINSQAELIGAIIGRTIIHINVNFWLDLPGFTVTPHIDNPGKASQKFTLMWIIVLPIIAPINSACELISFCICSNILSGATSSFLLFQSSCHSCLVHDTSSNSTFESLSIVLFEITSFT
jgi:hypothetical protein